MNRCFVVLRQALFPGVLAASLAACGGDFVPLSPSAQCGNLPVTSQASDRAQAMPITAIACQTMKQLDLRSAVIQVSMDGKLLYSAALGESAAGEPATTDMHFRNGAIAMTYMATVALQLVDENRLSLSDKVARWLPDLPAAEKVTVEMLLNHTSGYPDYVADPGFISATRADPLRHWTAEDMLSLAFNKSLVYLPGSNWNYSHTNYLVLGAIIEKVTDKPLADAIRARIVEPLGLRSTASSATPAIPTPVLRAFTNERGAYEESTFWNPSWTLPAGAVMTTDIADLRISAEAIMSGRLLSPPSFAVQTDARLVGLGDPNACAPGVCRANTEAGHFGLGMMISGPWLRQNALFGGYHVSIGMLPERGISIAVAATQGPNADLDRNGAEALMFAISRLAAPDKPVPIADGFQTAGGS